MKFLVILAALLVANAQSTTEGPLHCVRDCLEMKDTPMNWAMMEAKKKAWADCQNVFGNDDCQNRWQAIQGAETPCVNGRAGEFPCNNVDLLSFIPHRDMTGSGLTRGNDIWGWEDPLTGREYAIVCQTDGTTFVDVTDPVNPQVVGRLPSNNNNHVSWRDAKIFKDHVYIISEGFEHGMQVFDLTQLRNRTDSRPAQIVPLTAQYSEFGSCHNIALNEATGFAYGIGSRTCNGGPHQVDVNDPANPRFAGCFSNDGYTHDSECVIYDGPDTRYTGREICFHYNENTLTIVDHTIKGSPQLLSRLGYTGASYTHQGWNRADQQYLLLDDELDEQRGQATTRCANGQTGCTATYIWDIRDLQAPRHIGTYVGPERSIDHNQYIRGRYSYQSNYESGLRILDISQIAQARLTEAGFFDMRPESTTPNFNGVWSSFNYFRSGVVVSNSIERGLFVLRPNLPDVLSYDVVDA